MLQVAGELSRIPWVEAERLDIEVGTRIFDRLLDEGLIDGIARRRSQRAVAHPFLPVDPPILLGSLVERRNSSWMWPAIVVTVASLGSQLVQTLVFPSFSQLNQFYRATGTDNLLDALLAVPGLAYRIVVSDFFLLLKYDRVLIFLILLALAGIVLFIRRAESHLLIGAILATALYNITNGTPTQFRYATPGIIFFIVLAACVIHRTGRSISARASAIAPLTDRSASE